MNVRVKIEFIEKCNFSDRENMFSVAERLTNDESSIHVLDHQTRENILTAEFTITKTSQYKIVDQIAKEFKDSLQNYSNLRIDFPKHSIQVVEALQPTKIQFTKKQGQYLSFIHYYTKLNKRAPAESDFQKYFEVSRPSVHNMILKLEEKSLIGRVPGVSRSIKLRIDRSLIPDLDQQILKANKSIHPSAIALGERKYGVHGKFVVYSKSSQHR